MSVKYFDNLTALQVVDDEKVKNKFITLYDAFWGEGKGEVAYIRESMNVKRILQENDKLAKATAFSVFAIFVDLARSGLTLDQGSYPQCYILPRGRKIPNTNNYITHAYLSVSGYGELVMRIRAGQIRHADNPVVVYDNDKFSFEDVDGRKKVKYVCNLPHEGHRPVACFMRITRNDGTIDYAVMLEEDWRRLAQYSADKNNGKVNTLYGAKENGECAIDTGFLQAKTIKHAFRSYPKVRIGSATVLESETTEENDNEDFYGLEVDPETGEVLQPQAAAPTAENPGVTIEPQDDDDAF